FVSWRLIEIKTRGKFSSKVNLHAFSLIALFVIPICAIAVSGIFNNGYPSRVSKNVVIVEDKKFDFSTYREECHQDESNRYPYNKTCVLGKEHSEPDTVV